MLPEGDTEVPSRPRIAVGHVRGALLVPGGDEFDAVRAADRIDNRHVVDADDAEDVPHAGGNEKIDDDLRTRPGAMV